MHGTRLFSWLLIMLMAAGGGKVSAQVSPEIQLGARGVISFNADIRPDEAASAVNDFSDSGILLGFREKLYNRFRGQLVVGFQFPDAESDLGQLFFHQVFIKVQDRSNIMKIGRSRVRSALIEFPTLRDDDALHFTDVLNPFSGANTEDNQYGNVLEAAHIFGQRYWLRIHGEHFIETPETPGAPETDFSLNAIGLSFQYRVPETQRWNRPFVQHVGIGFNNFLTDRPGYTGEFERALKNVSVSAVLNLKRDPVHFIDLRHQTIYNAGFDNIKWINDFSTLTRARSIATFTSVRYLLRRLERPTLQIAASFGYKTFPEATAGSDQWQAVVNGFYRLGENFDVGLQLQHRQFRGDLKGMFGSNETRIQVGLVFSVDQSWNNQFDSRESLLNLEHGYIP